MKRCNMNKSELRKQMRRYRPKEDDCWASRLRFWPVLQKAKTVFCFLSLEDEPDTNPLIAWMVDNGKRVCIPRCKNNSGEMEAVLLDRSQQTTDALGIPSAKGRGIPPSEIDLALIPGLAFDSKGNRLGRGKGFYDRYLSSGFLGTTCGICPAQRFLSHLPAEQHDRPMDYIFTPYGLYKTNDE